MDVHIDRAAVMMRTFFIPSGLKYNAASLFFSLLVAIETELQGLARASFDDAYHGGGGGDPGAVKAPHERLQGTPLLTAAAAAGGEATRARRCQTTREYEGIRGPPSPKTRSC